MQVLDTCRISSVAISWVGRVALCLQSGLSYSLRVDLRSWVFGDISEVDDLLAELEASGATTVTFPPGCEKQPDPDRVQHVDAR